MLHLWLSTDRKRNTRQAFSLIRENYRPEGDTQILLVPEQFSHSVQEDFCRIAGDRASLMAQVLDFTRLAEEVFSREGGIADTRTGDAGRLLIMSLAVEQVRSRLKIYANAADKPEFLLQLLAMLDEFRSYCVTPESLRSASGRLEGVLGQKAEEFALLMESYDAVCETCGQNPQSLLNQLLDSLQESDYPADKLFYIEGFTDFTGVQQEILTELLLKAPAVHIFLQCPDLDGRTQQHDTARNAAKQLLSICGRCEIPWKLHPDDFGCEDELSYLRQRLFSGACIPAASDADTVSFLLAPDSLQQCRIAAGQILRRTAEGVRYRSIQIACADYEADRPVLESVLRRAGIPAYFAGNTDILRQPLIHMLLSALTAATGGMDQEAVLSYVKSSFSPLSRERSDCLENYILLWDISGKSFQEIWAMHPKGLNQEETETSARELQQLLSDRRVAIEPLLRLSKKLKKAANTGEMTLSFYDFLHDISIRERLEELAQQCFDRGEHRRSQEYVQLYDILTELLEQIYGVLGSSVHSGEEFLGIFRTALSRCSVGTIPAGLDCVTVGDLSSLRHCDCDELFLLGANEGCFPGTSDRRSLLTDRERRSLMDLGIGVSPTATGWLERELATIDSVLNGPRRRLWLGALEGKESYFFRRALELFPQSPRYTEDVELICRSHRDHLEYLTTHEIREGIAEAASVDMERLLSGARYSPENLNPEAVRALYGKTLRLSSSKIDCLASCGMQYFLNYGLKAKERKSVKMDASLFGTFVHYVLEHTTKDVIALGGFHRVSLSKTMEIAAAHMEEYTNRELKDLWNSQRAEYLFRRNFAEVEEVVRDLHEELSRSQFIPSYFELNFGKGGALPEIRILGKEMTATIEGYVDRADLWRKGDKLYVRIVDYKTGKKSFDYSKIYYGIGLQMLIYLFALEREGQVLCNAPLTPAGVLYFPARAEAVSVKSRVELPDGEKKKREYRKRSGLVLDSGPVLDAMEACPEGKAPLYLPYKVDKQGERKGDLASTEELALLGEFVFRKLAQLGDQLYSGDISPAPYELDGATPCAWCCYGSVCRENKKPRLLDKLKNQDAFWALIREEVENGG
ncbi:MAG: PD-(D/E)XK nuclease family protein [Oscillospiraceae bacterium]|nr:PD-(D/E)XK nuclease family protein [Oscillospiraceae bacterium]